MDLFSLMLLREFFTGPRRPWFHAKRMLFAAVAGSLILVTFFATANAARGTAGVRLFEFISWLTVLAACLLGPYIAASSLIGEKEGRTLDLLYMSDLNAAQLVLSKFLNAMIGASFTVLSIIPMFLLCVSLGGVAEIQIITALMVLFTAVVLGASLGMLVGVIVDSEAHTQRSLVIGFLVVFGLIPAIAYVFTRLTGMQYADATPKDSTNAYLAMFSPVSAIRSVVASEHPAAVHVNCVFNLLLSIPILGVAIYLLPRRLAATPGTWYKRLVARFDFSAAKAKRAHQKRPKLRGNPVLWKDTYVVYGGEDNVWVRAVLGCIAAVVVCGGVYVLVSVPTKTFQAGYLMLTGSIALLAVSAVSFVIGSVTRSVGALGREMNGRTLELLLSSDLTVTDIVDGKANAILMSVMPWIVGLGIGTVFTSLTGMVATDMPGQTVLIMLAVPLNAVGMVYAYNHMAMMGSLRMERQSTAAGISGFLVWYVVGNVVIFGVAIILSPFTAFLSLLLLPFLGPIIVGYQARLMLLRRLRRMAVRRAFQ